MLAAAQWITHHGVGEDGKAGPGLELEVANDILRWDLWCPDMGESGVEIDNNEAGSGVIVPDHKVNCSPSEVFFLIFLDFLGVNFCCIINSRGPGGPEAEVNPGPG